MEEQQTPPKAARQRKSKTNTCTEEGARQNDTANSDLQASAALHSPSQSILQSVSRVARGSASFSCALFLLQFLPER
jgi:hypothetical protein